MKMKNDHYVPLTRQTLGILEELRSINDPNTRLLCSPSTTATGTYRKTQ